MGLTGLGHIAESASVPNGSVVPGAQNTRDGDTGNEDDSRFAGFFFSVLP